MKDKKTYIELIIDKNTVNRIGAIFFRFIAFAFLVVPPAWLSLEVLTSPYIEETVFFPLGTLVFGIGLFLLLSEVR